MTGPETAGRVSADDAAAAEASANSIGKPTKTLPTERVTFQKQLTLLRAYAAASGQSGKPVGLQEVANIVKLNVSTVSLCNSFLADVGFIEKTPAGQYQPAPDVMNFLRAYQWNPETASQKLQPILRRTWFAQRLQPRLSMGSIEETEAIAELAEESHAAPRYQPNLKMLLDFLEAGGVVRRDGTLLRDGGGPQPETEASTREQPSSNGGPAMREVRGSSALATSFAQPTEGTVQFHISVKVDMNEFSGWKADRIAAFFGGIAQVLAAKGKLENDAAQ